MYIVLRKVSKSKSVSTLMQTIGIHIAKQNLKINEQEKQCIYCDKFRRIYRR